MMDKITITGFKPWSKDVYEEGKKNSTQEKTAKKTKNTKKQ